MFHFYSYGHLIDGWYLDLTVRDTHGYGLNPDIADPAVGRFLHAAEAVRVRLENNYLENTSGIYLYRFGGDSRQGQTIEIVCNRAKNMYWRIIVAAGGEVRC